MAAAERDVHVAGFPGTGDLSPSEGRLMAIFRVGFFPDFKWDDVVLVGVDRDGMCVFQSAVRSAHEDGEAAFGLHGIQHRIVRQNVAADIELGSPTVVWRFDDTKLAEILDMAVGSINVEHPAHDYFDSLNSAAATLMLSVDEYVDGGPFAEFPQGMPVPALPVESQATTVSGSEASPDPGTSQARPSPPSLPTEQPGTGRA
jgi:hypothetical protein